MGAEVLAASMIGMGVASGAMAYSSKREQSQQYTRDAAMLEAESQREAARVEDEAARFAEEQKMQYIGSGVEIGGSAVVTLAQTDKWAKAEAASLRTRGRALRSYNERAAKIARNEGIASFISGIGSGIGQGYSIYNYAKAGVGS